MTRYIIYGIVVLIFQFLIFNHLDISTYLIPQVFIVILITLPSYLSRVSQVLIGFSLGLIADFFVSTPGLHASACLWLIVLRFVLLASQDLQEQNANKVVYTSFNVGMYPFMLTATVLTFVYHFYIIWLESIGTFYFMNWLYTSVFSSIFTLTFIGLFQSLSYSKSRE